MSKHTNRQQKKTVRWAITNATSGDVSIYRYRYLVETHKDKEKAIERLSVLQTCNGGDHILEKVTRKYVMG